MNDLLQMHDIDKYYGSIKALDGAFLDVPAGEVHALLGVNGAGKSTLMKVLSGELSFEGGTVVFDGRTFKPGDKWNIADIGISMVHQEISTVPVISVACYMFLGREKTKFGLIDNRAMEADSLIYLKKIGANISPSAMMGSLSVAQQQLVEIAKALTFDIKLLILDEPTTAFGDKETAILFDVIRELRSKGVSVIYISHKLEEIGQIADRITVMKDGRYVKTLDAKNTSKAELVNILAGRDIVFSKKETNQKLKDSPTVLEVKNLSAKNFLSDVSFSLRKGEILGFAGLMGSGRTLTAKAICGIVPKESGEIVINGETAGICSPKDASRCGICYLSEDRNTEGMIQNRSIIANSVISSLDGYESGIVLNDQKMTDDAVECNRKLRTKYSDPHAPISSLSGGNRQKVIIARWLIKDLPVMIFDEPTKGIDVGAKDEIFRIINEIVDKGRSVILISSETEELLRYCDRIIVMSDGHISGEMDIADASPEKIVDYSLGGKHE